MTTTTHKCEYRAPNGRVLRVSGPVGPIDGAELARQRDVWLEANGDLLKGYSVEKFLEEKRRDVKEGRA